MVTEMFHELLMVNGLYLIHSITRCSGSRRMPPHTLAVTCLLHMPTPATLRRDFPAQRTTRACTHLCTGPILMSQIVVKARVRVEHA